MAVNELSRLEADLAIIQKLEDEPNDVGGMSAEDLKKRFDEGGLALQAFLNDVLIPELEACGVKSILRQDSGGELWLRMRSDRVIEMSEDGVYWVAAAGPDTTVFAAHRDKHRAGAEDEITPAMIGAAVRRTFTATVTNTWTEDGGWFYQDISVPGMLETDDPVVDILPGSDNEANLLYSEAICRVFRIATAANSIRVWATEAISTAFPIRLKVVR